MPRKSVPSYRLHKPSGQARTIIDGRHIYLGKFNSPESRRKYARLLAEMSDPKAQECQPAYPASTPLLLVSELLVKYLEYTENYYLGGNSSSKEFRAMVDAVAPVNEFYGDSPADEFGPLKLKTLRQHLVEHGLCRTEINKRVGRIKRVFKWAVSEELISSSIHEGLRSVTGLKFGRTTARESEPVKPVEERLIDLTLPFTSPQVDAMVRLQLLTGMRPSEAATMQSVYIDRNEDIWLYEPDNHKNRWRGHRRAIPLGPRSQEIMKPFLDRPESQFLFSPAEAEEWRNEQRVLHRNRRTPVYPCELITREKRRKEARLPKSKRPKENCYSADSYRRAIAYAIKNSNRERSKDDPKAIVVSSWTPYQLRHTFATRMRKMHGVEAAQLGLGHACTRIVDIYAEKNLSLLVELAKQNG